MRKITALVLVAAGMAACSFTTHGGRTLRGEGKVTTVTPTVSTFDGLDLACPVRANVHIKEGATPSISLTSYPNILDHISTKVSNGVLHIEFDEKRLSLEDGSEIVAEITVPTVKSLAMESAPSAYITGALKGDKFTVDISGAGKVDIEDMTLDMLGINISGAGKLEINKGKVHHTDYDISGAGKVHAYGVSSDIVSANISGAGKAEITAVNELSLDISGTGKVRYKGNPAKVKQNITGVASVSREDS